MDLPLYPFPSLNRRSIRVRLADKQGKVKEMSGASERKSDINFVTGNGSDGCAANGFLLDEMLTYKHNLSHVHSTRFQLTMD